ncbi:MAG: hypothetical protein H7839_18645 [Magnetococcus sp. YQC-5]
MRPVSLQQSRLSLAIIAVLLFLSVGFLQAQADQKHLPADPPALLDRWADFNSKCRGGSGDDQKTWDACDERDKMTEQLKAHGWCYGEPGQFGYQMEWHPCKQAM